MTREYERHNLDEKEIPRTYEAIFTEGEQLLGIRVEQRQKKLSGHGKPVWRWIAVAEAWDPGSYKEGDWTFLCSLASYEMTVREVVPAEATQEDYLDAMRLDAERLLERAQVFTRVLKASKAAAKPSLRKK